MIRCEECETLVAEDAPTWEVKMYVGEKLKYELETCSPCGEQLQDEWNDGKLKLTVGAENLQTEIDEVRFWMDGGRM